MILNSLPEVKAVAKVTFVYTTESIETDSKKLLMSAKTAYKIATPGNGEIIANSVLKSWFYHPWCH